MTDATAAKASRTPRDRPERCSSSSSAFLRSRCSACRPTDERFELHIESIPSAQAARSAASWPRPRAGAMVVLVDLQFGGRPMALHWHKRRWRCADDDCPKGSWTEQDDRIAHPRMKLTRRAALRPPRTSAPGRTVNEVAARARLRLAHGQRRRRRLWRGPRRSPGPLRGRQRTRP